jgi:acyl dehydratase
MKVYGGDAWMDGLPVRKFAEVRVGDALPPSSCQITRVGLFLFGVAYFTAHRIHYDVEYSREAGFADVLVTANLLSGLTARMLGRWAGDDGALRSLEERNVAPAFAGDTVVISGTVAEVLPSKVAGGLVWCELRVERTDGDRIVNGRAALLLPLGVVGPGAAWRVEDVTQDERGRRGQVPGRIGCIGSEGLEEVGDEPAGRCQGHLGGSRDDAPVGHEQQREVFGREVGAQQPACLGMPRQLGEAAHGTVAFLDVNNARDRRAERPVADVHGAYLLDDGTEPAPGIRVGQGLVHDRHTGRELAGEHLSDQ